MFGLSYKGKEALIQVIENLFDNIALDFLGNIPKLKNKKTLTITGRTDFSLPHLFIQAMGNRNPNSLETNVLKGLLDSAHGYIESLKNKTASNIAERIDGLTREAQIRKQTLKEEDVQLAIDEELKKAKSSMASIAEAESTKIRNLGSMMDITSVSSNIGDANPTVFFVVIKDQSTCKECVRLHLMPDGVTPRLWKLSELKQGYHERGEDNASAFGLHPHCRCTLTYLSQGFGFEQGKLKYRSHNYDAYSKQK